MLIINLLFSDTLLVHKGDGLSVRVISANDPVCMYMSLIIKGNTYNSNTVIIILTH